MAYSSYIILSVSVVHLVGFFSSEDYLETQAAFLFEVKGTSRNLRSTNTLCDCLY